MRRAGGEADGAPVPPRPQDADSHGVGADDEVMAEIRTMLQEKFVEFALDT
jgi:hypothetical protein